MNDFAKNPEPVPTCGRDFFGLLSNGWAVVMRAPKQTNEYYAEWDVDCNIHVPMPETIDTQSRDDFVQLVDWCEIPQAWRDQQTPSPKGSLEYDGMTDARCSGSSLRGDM